MKNEDLGKLPFHQFPKKLSFSGLLWDFDAISLHPSNMWDEKSVYPQIDTGYAFAKDMRDELVNKLNNQTFTQGKAILKNKY